MELYNLNFKYAFSQWKPLKSDFCVFLPVPIIFPSISLFINKMLYSHFLFPISSHGISISSS